METKKRGRPRKVQIQISEAESDASTKSDRSPKPIVTQRRRSAEKPSDQKTAVQTRSHRGREKSAERTLPTNKGSTPIETVVSYDI